MEPVSPPIFISYARLDQERARHVYDCLMRGGLECWMDEKSLRVGQDWQREIDKAIRTSQIFVACLSSNAVNHRGFFQTELRKAYEVWKTIPPQQVYLVPVRLDACEIPDEIQRLHVLDFFVPEGPVKLLRDLTHFVAPEAPAALLRQALDLMRTYHLPEALNVLDRLKAVVDDRNPELRARTLFDIACALSMSAEQLPSKEQAQKEPMLDRAFAALREWYEYGSSSAWVRTGRTVENEIYRMGSDADLLCLLRERPADIRNLLGENAKALPDRLPRRSGGGGGGCVLATQVFESPTGAVRFEDLRPGMSVLSCLPGEGHRPLPAHVLATYTTREPECVILNGRWIVTCSQPLFDLGHRKIRAGELQIGARLAMRSGAGVTIESLERLRGHFEVGTITTGHASHNFVCDGLICANWDSK